MKFFCHWNIKCSSIFYFTLFTYCWLMKVWMISLTQSHLFIPLLSSFLRTWAVYWAVQVKIWSSRLAKPDLLWCIIVSMAIDLDHWKFDWPCWAKSVQRTEIQSNALKPQPHMWIWKSNFSSFLYMEQNVNSFVVIKFREWISYWSKW